MCVCVRAFFFSLLTQDPVFDLVYEALYICTPSARRRGKVEDNITAVVKRPDNFYGQSQTCVRIIKRACHARIAEIHDVARGGSREDVCNRYGNFALAILSRV